MTGFQNFKYTCKTKKFSRDFIAESTWFVATWKIYSVQTFTKQGLSIIAIIVGSSKYHNNPWILLKIRCKEVWNHVRSLWYRIFRFWHSKSGETRFVTRRLPTALKLAFRFSLRRCLEPRGRFNSWRNRLIFPTHSQWTLLEIALTFLHLSASSDSESFRLRSKRSTDELRR